MNTPTNATELAEVLGSSHQSVAEYEMRIGQIVAPDVLEQFYLEKGWI